MVCAPEMLGKYYRSTNALMPLAADATRLLTARFPACVAGKRRGSIFRGSAIQKGSRSLVVVVEGMPRGTGPCSR